MKSIRRQAAVLLQAMSPPRRFTTALGWPLLACAACFSIPIAFAQTERRPLTNVAQVIVLSPKEAQLAQPVRLRAVVTYYDAAWGFLFVQDDTAGVRVRVPQNDLPLARGQLVSIEGITAALGHCACVDKPVIKPLRPAALPAARRAAIAELESDQFCCRRVEVEGVVSAVVSVEDRVLLQLQAGTNHLKSILRDVPSARVPELRGLIDARVRVRGVAGVPPEPQDTEFLSTHLFVNGLEDVTTVRPAPEQPFAAPVTWLGSIIVSNTDHRVKVLARVVSATNGTLVLEDSSGRMRARTDQTQTTPTRPGDLAELLGFPASERDETILDHALYRLIAPSGSAKRAAVTNRLDWPPAPHLSLLQEISAVRRLAPDEAAFRFPVRLRGIVTFLDANYGYLYIQDATTGILIMPVRTNLMPVLGQIVEVTGFSVPGLYAPAVYDAVIAPGAQGELPAPREWSQEDFKSGRWEGDLVALEGIVRHASVLDRHLWLRIATSGGIVRAIIPPGGDFSEAGSLVDAEVRARGVCTFEANDRRQITGLRLFVQQLGDVTVVRQPGATNPFALPALTIASLFQINPEQKTGHRVKIKGVVTLQRFSQGFYLKDTSAPLWIELAEPQTVQPGDELEVAGFPTMVGRALNLQSATFRRTGSAPLPKPVRVTGPQAATGRYDADYVTLEARFLEVARPGNSPTLFLQARSTLFEAPVANTNALVALQRIKPGSLLRLTGICSNQGEDSQGPRAFRILLNSEADVVVLKTPPWWTSQRTVTLGGVMAGLIAIAFAWVALLRYQVLKQTAHIRQLNASLEHRVAERTAELEAANRELESFSYSVSHDLRAPLRSVNGFAEILLQTHAPQLGEKGSRYLRNVADSGRQMGRLVDDLLTFSRLGRQSLAKSPLDLNGLVAPIIEDLRAHDPQRRVTVHVQPLPPSEGDRALIHQVLVNLLSNAWKFTSKRLDAVIEVGSVTNGHGLVYYVKDNGAGFDMQYAGKLFGVFQRLHPDDEFPGTGVGLAIVQRVIHRHGGRIWAESKPDAGATFHFTLPAGSLKNEACTAFGK